MSDLLRLLSRRYHNPLGQAQFKLRAEDFRVDEVMDFEPAGSGEHAWVLIRKQGQNTVFVAENLARFCGIRKFDVGYSGLKDRQSVSTQWMSCYLGKRPEPDWSQWQLPGIDIVRVERHSRKLRRGEHQANAFVVRLKSCVDLEHIVQGLDDIRNHGFPNYFGPQRFGRDAFNILGAARFFEGRARASKSQRGFFLSAVRSFLFNRVISERLRQNRDLDVSTASLFGDCIPEKSLSMAPDEPAALSALEFDILSQYPVFKQGLCDHRVSMDRRDSFAKAFELKYEKEGSDLIVSFRLKPGVFATSLFRECANLV